MTLMTNPDGSERRSRSIEVLCTLEDVVREGAKEETGAEGCIWSTAPLIEILGTMKQLEPKRMNGASVLRIRMRTWSSSRRYTAADLDEGA